MTPAWLGALAVSLVMWAGIARAAVRGDGVTTPRSAYSTVSTLNRISANGLSLPALLRAGLHHFTALEGTHA